jgi:hypothetical protein
MPMWEQKIMPVFTHFAYGSVFAEKIEIIVATFGSSGLNETAGSDSKNYVKKIIFLNEIHCLLEAAGSDPAVSLRPRELYETAGIFLKNEYWLSFPLKGNHRKNKYICKHYIPTVIKKRQY